MLAKNSFKVDEVVMKFRVDLKKRINRNWKAWSYVLYSHKITKKPEQSNGNKIRCKNKQKRYESNSIIHSLHIYQMV